MFVALIWDAGCATPTPDPLAGWNFCFSQDTAKLDRAIRNDYEDYIQKLPPKEKYYVPGGGVNIFENGTGGHAVKIEIPLNGAYSDHILFYDKENKRVKVTIIAGGRYSS